MQIHALNSENGVSQNEFAVAFSCGLEVGGHFKAGGKTYIAEFKASGTLNVKDNNREHALLHNHVAMLIEKGFIMMCLEQSMCLDKIDENGYTLIKIDESG